MEVMLVGRRPRIEYDGAIYHVIQRGNNREYIFDEHRWKRKILEEIMKSIALDHMELFAFVIMGNHYHLALRTGEPSLSKIMHRINGNFGKYYNRDRVRSGPFFEGRYKAFLIEDESYLLTVIRYIHRNPVRAGICSTVDAYNWSSDQAYRAKDYDFVSTNVLMSILGSRPDQSYFEYNRLMGLDDDYDEHQLKYVGTEEFWSLKQNHKQAEAAIKEDLEIILHKSGATRQEIMLIKSGCKQKELMVYKRSFVQNAVTAGYTMEEIGKHISISGVAVGKLMRKLEC